MLCYGCMDVLSTVHCYEDGFGVGDGGSSRRGGPVEHVDGSKHRTKKAPTSSEGPWSMSIVVQSVPIEPSSTRAHRGST